ncbi:glutamine--fructose-6-phosphate transaminase (isomerizing) [Solimonas sp. K1W22B-7]|uniref:glutamine--fructose-6-phosphate transaminase (isomerizing) n=1 Tax=Solimonas sp. K1W22B-7 TaxID=2303331 RepID=UPI000E3347B4|nr:glutamine--fructose-6-phosphate transaminase (isomerizing) [Solimonas sp. K1W22B-7]AXQ27639.1 glutamine--fructose-6-phosphate transaminase (isomerizing) [Solimonas sp. K1W22B-7]
MCGIVGAVAQRNVTPILIEGLKRLEYRGYDSAGVAVIDAVGQLHLTRAVGKVAQLEAALVQAPNNGGTGIAHTRWATHGVPAERNSHPHVSGDVALVHNGIIENHDELRAELKAKGYAFSSETDTEVVAHLVHEQMKQGAGLRAAMIAVLPRLHGAYALAVICGRDPGRMMLARKGSPLVIGIGIGEHFAASDALALLPVTNRFVYLEEGDVAEIRTDGYSIIDTQGRAVERKLHVSSLSSDAVDKGSYRHFMQKEIFEQPTALANTLEGRLSDGRVLEACLGPKAGELLARIKRVRLVACGTSSHAGMVARYWFEQIAKVPCQVELASEFRYRDPVIEPDTLFITISQSGETADTLEALRHAKGKDIAASLVVCNAPESSLVRESDIALMTHAGPERSVASTKAFTTQLMALALVMLLLARRNGLSPEAERRYVKALESAAGVVEAVLRQDQQLQKLAERLIHKQHALFLGRGSMSPVAMEGALKLKEISYIHAEAYAAGELKHGPLALVDEHMPVIAVAPNDELLEKVKSNLQEVAARGGELIVFADREAGFKDAPGVTVIGMPHADELIDPIVYTVPLQLLAYHVAVLKGTDVDQPRNLAKSVTVE